MRKNLPRNCKKIWDAAVRDQHTHLVVYQKSLGSVPCPRKASAGLKTAFGLSDTSGISEDDLKDIMTIQLAEFGKIVTDIYTLPQRALAA